MKWEDRGDEQVLVAGDGRVLDTLFYRSGRWHNGLWGPMYLDLEAAKAAVMRKHGLHAA
jgi:hypothetical protein